MNSRWCNYLHIQLSVGLWGCVVTVFSSRKHESRVGELYNAEVPTYDEKLAEQAKIVDKQAIPYGRCVFCALWIVTVFGADDMDEEMIEDYLKKGRAFTMRSDDFLLKVLYDYDFDVEKALSRLPKVGIWTRFHL